MFPHLRMKNRWKKSRQEPRAGNHTGTRTGNHTGTSTGCAQLQQIPNLSGWLIEHKELLSSRDREVGYKLRNERFRNRRKGSQFPVVESS